MKRLNALYLILSLTLLNACSRKPAIVMQETIASELRQCEAEPDHPVFDKEQSQAAWLKNNKILVSYTKKLKFAGQDCRNKLGELDKLLNKLEQ